MPSQLLSNKYLLLEPIAAGGMAEIYLAKHSGPLGFEKLVVIKRILSKFADKAEYKQMFLEEAKIAADLRHPNIVSTIESGSDQGVYFMVMEYLHGLDLRHVVKTLTKDGRLMPLDLCISVAVEVLAGLHYAHNKKDLNGRPLGIVHRDVSPQNIVVTFEGETKIVDFGIAHARHQRQSEQGVLRGKFAYMSPEQATGQPIDHRSDQFSLAVVLYELTTGRRLLRRENEKLTIAAAAQCKIPLPSQFDPSYPKLLESILLKALSKNPDQRFASCEELKSELQGFLNSQNSHPHRSDLAKYLAENFASKVKTNKDLSPTYLQRNTRSEFSHTKKISDVSSAKKLSRRAAFVVASLLMVAGLGGTYLLYPSSTEKPVAVDDKIPKYKPENFRVDAQSFGEPAISNSEEKKPPKKAFGRLKIVVEPWGEIYVDGKKIGLTPIAPQKIREGNHKIRIVNSRLAKEKTLEVKIVANQDTLVRYQF